MSDELDLRAMIEADKRRRAEEFSQALQELMAEYHCQLVPQIMITGQTMRSEIVIVPGDV